MARTKKLVIGNWKMYIDTPKKAKEVIQKISRSLKGSKRTEVVICPPAPFLGFFLPSVSRSILFGAQDVSTELEAPRTGETSVYMLRALGVTYVIVGHSERRALGETDVRIAQKVARVLKVGLTPVLCIGESTRDMRGDYLAFLEKEIREGLAGIPRAKAEGVVIAYEPLWAIGKSAEEAVTPHVLHETTLFITKILVSMYGRSVGTKIRILYGGSVEASNASTLVSGGAVDGVLVGHASVEPDEFRNIIRALDAR